MPLIRWTEYCAVAAIVLSFAALATTWALIVPIFQSPDEPEHFDYAYRIARHGGLVLARDGAPRASTTVASLEDMLGTKGIIFHPGRRVDSGYGTPPYFEALSELARRSARRSNDALGVPILVSTYPFGFYMFVGAAIAPVSRWPVVAFFSARAVCIGLVSCGWLFAYGLMRELNFARRRALLLLFICAGIPLSVFVAAYVQPDDFTFFVAMATFYAAARLRRRPTDAPAYVGFALGWALMISVKQHVALAVGLGAFPYVALRLATVVRSRLCLGALLGLMVLGVSAVFAVSTYVSAGGEAPSYYHGALVRNVRNAPAAVIPAISEFFNYPIGITANSYWGIYGWLDTPLEIHPLWIDGPLRLGLRAGTWLVVAAIPWLMVRNFRHLVVVARRRGIGCALRIGLGDVMVNTYLIFVAIMIALYTLSANAFGAQGRNWFPFVVPALATAVVYAPKTLPRGWARRSVSGAAVAFLVAYVGVASWSAIRSVEDRYYGARTPLAAVVMPPDRYEYREFRGTGVIDTPMFDVSRDSAVNVRISGWIVDARNVPPSGVIVTYGARGVWYASTDADRRDIPARVRNGHYPNIGFVARLHIARRDWRGLRPLALTAVTADGLYAERFPWRFSRASR